MSILWVSAYISRKMYVLKKQLSDSCQAANMDISLVKFGHPVGFLDVIPNT